METKKAKGSQGSWFAEVDGELLPCLHGCFWSNGKYEAPIRNDSHFKRMEELAKSLKEKLRAILTTDETFETLDGYTGFKRTGYIAVFAVENIIIDRNYLRLTFVKRLCNLK